MPSGSETNRMARKRVGDKQLVINRVYTMGVALILNSTPHP